MTLDIHDPLRANLDAARDTASSTGQFAQAHVLRSALTKRMAGPGGAYNIGNLIGLCQGITVQVLVSRDPNQLPWTGASAAVSQYLTGNFAAIAMTAATAIFLASGEAYHRAWNGHRRPRENMNRLGDFLSGVGAICLGLALFELGHPFLALTSGLLHSVGKFGSACHRSGFRTPSITPHGLDLFRTMVLLSRIPAIVVSGFSLYAVLFEIEGEQVQHWSTSVSLLACYLLWSWADLLLFRSSPRQAVRDRDAG